MKAILVIDMPKIDKNTKNGCRDCRYAEKRMTLSEEYTCVLTGQSAYVYDMKCPLRPLPQKKEVEVNKIEDIMHTEYSIDDIYKQKYVTDIRLATDKLISLGWNACIDEILGAKE